MDRDQVEDIVDARIASAMAPILRFQSETRERFLSIDGNGSGRKGALQRQDDKMEEIDGKVTTLLHRSGELAIEQAKASGAAEAAAAAAKIAADTKKVKLAWWQWALRGLGALAMLLLSHYLGKKGGF